MGPAVAVVARILRNPRLRRMVLAFVLFALAEYGTWLAVMVYAFQHGGTTNAAVIAAVQLIPAAIVAPLVAQVTDRRGGPWMLLLGYLLQAGAVTGTAVAMLTHCPSWLVYVGAVVLTSAVTITRPAQASAVATQVEHPEELTAANVVNGWADSGALLAGPALAGVLIAIDGPGLALSGFGVGLVLAAIMVAPAALSSPVGPPLAISIEEDSDEPVVEEELVALAEASQTRIGRLQTLTSGPVLAVLGVMAAEYLALGALDVLVVVLAVHTLGLSPAFAGYIDASFGVGSVLGAIAAVRLVGASSLARPLCFAAVAWGLCYSLLGGDPTLGSAFVLLAAAGLAHTIVDTSGRALLARVTPLSRLGRVFGMLEGMTTAALAAGALVVPLFFDLGGVRLALIGVAFLLVTAVLVPFRLVRAADRHAPAIDGVRRLHGHPLFARLALPSLEELARELAISRVPSGTAVVRQGEPGETFYLIAEGESEVAVDGRDVGRLGPGQGFGEIALLHDVARTATVTTVTDSILYALARRPFLAAMGATPPRVSLPGHDELGAGGLTDGMAGTVDT